jgi:hypothetical protein
MNEFTAAVNTFLYYNDTIYNDISYINFIKIINNLDKNNQNNTVNLIILEKYLNILLKNER